MRRDPAARERAGRPRSHVLASVCKRPGTSSAVRLISLIDPRWAVDLDTSLYALSRRGPAGSTQPAGFGSSGPGGRGTPSGVGGAWTARSRAGTLGSSPGLLRQLPPPRREVGTWVRGPRAEMRGPLGLWVLSEVLLLGWNSTHFRRGATSCLQGRGAYKKASQRGF